MVVCEIYLGMIAAAQIVAQDNAIGGRPAQGVALAGDQGEHFPEPFLVAQHQISGPRVNHGKFVTSRHKKWCDSFTISARLGRRQELVA